MLGEKGNDLKGLFPRLLIGPCKILGFLPGRWQEFYIDGPEIPLKSSGRPGHAGHPQFSPYTQVWGPISRGEIKGEESQVTR